MDLVSFLYTLLEDLLAAAFCGNLSTLRFDHTSISVYITLTILHHEGSNSASGRKRSLSC